MAGEESFDPKSWGQSGQAQSQLPEAWRSVAEDIAAPRSSPEPPVAAKRDLRPIFPYLASAAILLLGGVAAWATSAPPVVDATAAAPVEQGLTETDALSSRSLVLASAADLEGALTAAGLAPQEAAAANAAAMQALSGVQGEIRAVLDLLTGSEGIRLNKLQASLPDGSGVVVNRGADGQFTASRVTAQLSSQIKVVSGELDSNTFYSSAVAAGVLDSLIPEFVNAFTFDFDLQQEISPGDTFEVAYEQTVNAEGQPLGQPQLLYASLVTATKRRALYKFKPAGEDGGWYDGNGASTVRSFMRTPVDGARISSKFGPRFHPTLKYTRLHGGTDFAAPVGTPIYAAADGTITSASPSGCAGNMVIMRHDNGWETRYFHLSRYADGLAAGNRVTQGYTIGLVGNTGSCTTGPHLHYEVHVDGQKVDPLGIKTDAGKKGLEGAALAAFIQQRDRVDVARAQQAQ